MQIWGGGGGGKYHQIKFKEQLPGARICAPRPTVEGGPGLDGGRGPTVAPLPPGGADRVSGPDGGPALPGAGGPVPGGGGPWLLPVGTIARPLPPEILKKKLSKSRPNSFWQPKFR